MIHLLLITGAALLAVLYLAREIFPQCGLWSVRADLEVGPQRCAEIVADYGRNHA